MTETYGIGFKLGNEELRDQVEAALRKLFADGTAAKIAEQYGIDTFVQLPIDPALSKAADSSQLGQVEVDGINPLMDMLEETL